MKKVLSLCLAIMASISLLRAAEEPVTISAPDQVIDKTAYTITEQGITISVSYGSAYPAGHSYNNLGVTYFACLAGGNMTISAEQAIQGIAINGWVKKNFSASCDHGTINYLSDPYDDSTGEPVLTISDVKNTSVTINCVNQLRCFSVEVYFSENPGGTQGEVMDTVRFTAVIAEALDYSEDTAYSSEGSYSYWLKLASEAGYPEVWLDLYAATVGDLSGEYSPYNYNVGDYTYVQLSTSSLDYEYAYDQEFTITKTTNGYHIEGWIIADNDVQYEFVYDGAITLTLPPIEEEGIEDIQQDNVQSTKVLREGQLYIIRGDKTYTMQGTKCR